MRYITLFLLLATALSIHAQPYNVIVDVTDYGAVGDDDADDTDAIQDAIDYAQTQVDAPCCFQTDQGPVSWANAVVVYIPRGTYKIDGTLVIGGGNRVVLRGDGFAGSNSSSILRMTNANNDIIQVNGLTPVSIESLYFQGPWPASTGTGSAIRVKAVVDSRITRNWCNGMPKACVYAEAAAYDVDGLTNTHIVDNGFENSPYGLLLDRSINNLIQGNRFYSLRTAVRLNWGEFNQISNNLFDLCGRLNDQGAAIHVQHTFNIESRQLHIGGNLFNKNGNDIMLKGATYQGAPMITNVFVEGNTSDRPLYSFLVADTVADTTVVANRIADASAIEDPEDPTAQYPAIRITGTSDDTTLYDNVQTTRLWPARYGLQVDAGTTDTAIGANVFKGNLAAVHIASGATLAATHVQEPVSRAKETGTVGLRFRADAANRDGGYNVNFKMKRVSAPSAVTISNCVSANLAASPLVTSITADGFRFNILSAAAGDTYAVDCTYEVAAQ